MTVTRSYVVVDRKMFPEDDDPTPFTISIAEGEMYSSRNVPAFVLRRLRADITDVLADWPRSMEWGDLGLTDPDDIAF